MERRPIEHAGSRPAGWRHRRREEETAARALRRGSVRLHVFAYRDGDGEAVVKMNPGDSNVGRGEGCVKKRAPASVEIKREHRRVSRRVSEGEPVESVGDRARDPSGANI